MTGARLNPVHHSVRKRGKIKPNNMARAEMSAEQYETLLNVALKIFADCSNVGQSFNDAILAVYISGLEHGARSNMEIEYVQE